MKTTRPDYMAQGPIAVFRDPRVSSMVIFTIPLGSDVEILEKDIRAIDGMSGGFYKNPIFLHMIRFDRKIGYVNRRWLK